MLVWRRKKLLAAFLISGWLKLNWKFRFRWTQYAALHRSCPSSLQLQCFASSWTMDDLIDSSEFAENFHFDQDLDHGWPGRSKRSNGADGILGEWGGSYGHLHFRHHKYVPRLARYIFSHFKITPNNNICTVLFWRNTLATFFFTKLVQINILIIFTLMYKTLYDVLVIYFL